MAPRLDRYIDKTGLCISLGIGVATSLYGVTVWSPATLAYSAADSFCQDLGTISSLVNVATFALSAAAASTLASRGKPIPMWGRSAAVAASFLAFALWLLVLLPMGIEGGLGEAAGQIALFAAACVMSGASIGLSMVAWANATSETETPLPRLIAISMAAAAVFSTMMAACTPGNLRIAVLMLFCLESVLLGFAAQRGRVQESEDAAVLVETRPYVARTRLAVRGMFAIVVAAVVATFVAPITNTVIMSDVLASSERYVTSTLSCLAAALVFVAVWAVPKRTPSSLNVLLAYNGCLLALVTLALFVPVFSMPLLVFGSMGFFVTWFVTCEASVNVAREYSIPKTVVYGGAAAVAMLARIVADNVAQVILVAPLLPETKTVVAVFILVYLATCALFLLYGVLVRRRLEPVEPPLISVAEAPSESPSAPVSPEVPFEDMAAGFGLSKREIEVLGLIMHGRNVPAMAEELTVSRNTVQTHVRHIYEQLGVHSRKELVGLVSSWNKGH